MTVHASESDEGVLKKRESAWTSANWHHAANNTIVVILFLVRKGIFRSLALASLALCSLGSAFPPFHPHTLLFIFHVFPCASVLAGTRSN
jgi:hypothetical protein